MENYIRVFLFKFFLKIKFLGVVVIFYLFLFSFLHHRRQNRGTKAQYQKREVSVSWCILYYIIMYPRRVCMFCSVCYQKCQIELLEIGNIYICLWWLQGKERKLVVNCYV